MKKPKPITPQEDEWLYSGTHPFRTRKRQVAFYERYRIAFHCDKRAKEVWIRDYDYNERRLRRAWKKVMAAKDTDPLAGAAVAAYIKAQMLEWITDGFELC